MRLRDARVPSARARRALYPCADTTGLRGSRHLRGTSALRARDSRTRFARFRRERSLRARSARACRVRSPCALSLCALAVRSLRALSEHSRRVRSLARACSRLLPARHHRRARGRAERVGRVGAREPVFAQQRARVPGEQGASVRRRPSAGQGGAVPSAHEGAVGRSHQRMPRSISATRGPCAGPAATACAPRSLRCFHWAGGERQHAQYGDARHRAELDRVGAQVVRYHE